VGYELATRLSVCLGRAAHAPHSLLAGPLPRCRWSNIVITAPLRPLEIHLPRLLLLLLLLALMWRPRQDLDGSGSPALPNGRSGATRGGDGAGVAGGQAAGGKGRRGPGTPSARKRARDVSAVEEPGPQPGPHPHPWVQPRADPLLQHPQAPPSPSPLRHALPPRVPCEQGSGTGGVERAGRVGADPGSAPAGACDGGSDDCYGGEGGSGGDAMRCQEAGRPVLGAGYSDGGRSADGADEGRCPDVREGKEACEAGCMRPPVDGGDSGAAAAGTAPFVTVREAVTGGGG
jgi:hypothetical protein